MKKKNYVFRFKEYKKEKYATAGEVVDARTRAHMKLHDVSYVKAMEHVLNADKDLAERYLARE